ncbi:hypothetical protein T4B_7913 [Trichinella pseudospiralis]|uniref:Uncharacterized protein n=1 Tax=Trichinella pseudospiralis TaxID=6337 RepID=A0A0V1G756_TRIPS|nr:hypothetical protein T4B_7913 [Trichinella pseudospiralis]
MHDKLYFIGISGLMGFNAFNVSRKCSCTVFILVHINHFYDITL